MGDGFHAVFDEVAGVVGDAINGLHDGVGGSVAGAGVLEYALGGAEADGGSGDGGGAAGDVDVVELVFFVGGGDGVFDERGQVVVIHELFLVSDFFEAFEDGVDFVFGEVEAEVFEAGGHGVAAAVFREGEFGAAPADVFRVHNFVGFAFFEDAVLVDARAVGKGIFADDGFAAGDVEAAHAADDTGGFEDFAGDDLGMEVWEGVGAGFDGHDDFFEGAVACALADAVECAFDLAGSGVECGQGVGDGEAEVVVAMDAEGSILDA